MAEKEPIPPIPKCAVAPQRRPHILSARIRMHPLVYNARDRCLKASGDVARPASILGGYAAAHAGGSFRIPLHSAAGVRRCSLRTWTVPRSVSSLAMRPTVLRFRDKVNDPIDCHPCTFHFRSLAAIMIEQPLLYTPD